MNLSELVFVGIRGSVVALSRTKGHQVWATRLKGRDFVNVLLDNGTVLASCQGEVFCLDARTGNAIWHNPLKGFGTGLATLVTASSQSVGSAAVISEQRRRGDEEAAGAAAAASAAC